MAKKTGNKITKRISSTTKKPVLGNPVKKPAIQKNLTRKPMEISKKNARRSFVPR